MLACLRGSGGNDENAEDKKGIIHQESTIDQKDSGTSHQGSAIFGKDLTHLHQKSTTSDPQPGGEKIPTLPYAYEPIDSRAREIRLLTIFGGNFDSRIKCSLSPVKLDTSPFYEALSYVWELNPPLLPKAGEMPPEPPMFPITLVNPKDETDIRSFHVGENLRDALQYIRFEDKPRTFWIDAICINQKEDPKKSNPEKPFQLAMMTEIYMMASDVTLWLGPAGDNSGMFFREAPEYSKHVEKEFPEKSPTTRLRDHQERWSAASHAALIKLAERRWWRRVWCLQEVAVAKDITLQCGYSKLSWREFDQVMDNLNKTYVYIIKEDGFNNAQDDMIRANRRVDPLRDLRRTWAISDDRLIHLSSRFRDWDATDLRDKVYALRGLARAADRHMFKQQPDLTLNEAQVFADMIVHSIVETKQLDALSRNYMLSDEQENNVGSKERILATPTWVVDWLSKKRVTVPFVDTSKDVKLFTASLDIPAKISVDYYNWRFLNLSGIHTDTVELLEDAGVPKSMPSFHTKLQDWLQNMYKWCQNETPNPYGTEEDFREAIRRTMIADVIHESRVPLPRFRALWDEWSRVQDPGDDSFKDFPSSSLAFSIALAEALTYRKMIYTRDGYVGLAPCWAQKGDLVCILFGGQTPYLLRPVNGDKTRRYVFIGDCYVHGIMSGEALSRIEIASAETVFSIME